MSKATDCGILLAEKNCFVEHHLKTNCDRAGAVVNAANILSLAIGYPMIWRIDGWHLSFDMTSIGGQTLGNTPGEALENASKFCKFIEAMVIMAKQMEEEVAIRLYDEMKKKKEGK